MLDVEDADRPVPQRLWRPMTTLRADLPLDDALTAMRRAATHLAAVADRPGGCSVWSPWRTCSKCWSARYATPRTARPPVWSAGPPSPTPSAAGGSSSGELVR